MRCTYLTKMHIFFVFDTSVFSSTKTEKRLFLSSSDSSSVSVFAKIFDTTKLHLVRLIDKSFTMVLSLMPAFIVLIRSLELLKATLCSATYAARRSSHAFTLFSCDCLALAAASSGLLLANWKARSIGR